MHGRSQTGSHRRRRVAGALLAVVLAALGLSVVTAAPSEAASNGTALVRLYDYGTYSYIYRQGLTITGVVEDASNSCYGITRDCDVPTGNLTIYSDRDPNGYVEATTQLQPFLGNDNLARFEVTIPGDRLLPGHYALTILYSDGNFDAHYSEDTLDVLKDPAR